MSAISSQKEYFLDKLSTLEENIQENYFNHIENYIKTEESPRECNISVMKNALSRTAIMSHIGGSQLNYRGKRLKRTSIKLLSSTKRIKRNSKKLRIRK